MGRFRIDDPEIDIEALEARVDAAIESKLGRRFTAAELEELRRAPLRPRLRREDLPRGLVEQLSTARGRLPEPEPPPPPVDREHPLPEFDPDRARPPEPALAKALGAVHREGFRGRIDRWLRRVARPLYRATINLEHALARVEEQLELLADRDDRYLDTARAYVDERVDRTADALKEALDRRIDQTADWSGQHASRLTGTLEQRHERLLHLAHNLVFELTNARLDQENMQARINEITARVNELEERNRALQRLALGETAE